MKLRTEKIYLLYLGYFKSCFNSGIEGMSFEEFKGLMNTKHIHVLLEEKK
jgi:hypothetical protein